MMFAFKLRRPYPYYHHSIWLKEDFDKLPQDFDDCVKSEISDAHIFYGKAKIKQKFRSNRRKKIFIDKNEKVYLQKQNKKFSGRYYR